MTCLFSRELEVEGALDGATGQLKSLAFESVHDSDAMLWCKRAGPQKHHRSNILYNNIN